MPEVELRYLDIRWQSPGKTKSVTVAPQCIPIETEHDGTMCAETEIFHDLYPTLGVRLSTSLAGCEPVFVTADQERLPMQPVPDSDGQTWWVEAGPWDQRGKRHLCELHRTVGEFEIEIGDERLLLNNIAAGLGRAGIEDFLQDFQNDLYWLLLGFGAGKATLGGRTNNSEVDKNGASNPELSAGDHLLAEALKAFSAAAERVLERPAHAIHEIGALQALARLRPTPASFRQYSRNPAATKLQGRQAEISVDIAENRYLRHMVQTASRLAKRMAFATRHQAQILSARSEAETVRCEEYRSTHARKVDPKVFDRQLAEMQGTLERIRSFSECEPPHGSRPVRHFSLRIDKPYSWGSGGEYFCRKLDENRDQDVREGIRFRVVKFPRSLEREIIAARPLRPVYEIEAVASVEKIGQDDQGRLLRLQQVVSVQPRTDAIEKKLRKRQRLEANDWLAPLSRDERLELQQEAQTAELRARVYADRAADGNLAAVALESCWKRLDQQDRSWADMGVGSDPQFPFGMRFSQNPAYAACLSAFRKVSGLAQRAGFGADTLDALDRIGILHASAIYEHWCLVKILLVLTEEFHFVPQAGWQETLIRGVTGNRETVSLELKHDALDLEARLDVQPVLPNGRTPDFRLRFKSNTWVEARRARSIFSPSADENLDWDAQPALVMDAKFRNSWNPGGLEDVLATLVETKRYGGEHDRVFILQPAAETIAEPSSPLAWGAECDYGHEADLCHKKGHIRLAPGESANRSTVNLKRLVALHLQSCFPTPGNKPTEPPEKDFSLCIRCGTKHLPEKTQWRSTQRGNPYWVMACSGCETYTTRTHCFNCGGPLFKNGFQLTYHKTLADQITNICCPACGAFFEQETNYAEELVQE